MKNPWQIRFDTALEVTRKYIRNTGKSIDAIDIQNIEREIFNTSQLAPSTDDMRIYPFEDGFDFERFLAYLYAIKNDSDFIENSLSYLESISNNIDISVQLEKLSLKSTEKIGNKFVALLSASTFIDSVTREIKIPEEIQISNLGLSLAGDMLSLTPIEQGLQQPVAYVNDDVSYTIIQQTTMTGFNVNGNRASVLNNSFRRGVNLSVYTLNIEEVAVEFRLQTRYVNVDSIRLELNPGTVGMRIVAFRLEEIGKELEQITDTLINQESIDLAVTGNVRELIIRMYKNYPDIIIPERKEYQFVIEKVRAISNNTTRAGTAITSSIEVPEGTGYVALVVEDYIPRDGSINYQIATLAKENDPNEPVSWFNIKPNNKQPAIDLVNNELPPDRFISLSKGKGVYSIQKTDRWQLPLINTYRVPLYNILEGMNVQIGNDLKIENGILKPASSTIVVDYGSINIYNGQEDWEVIDSQLVTTSVVENVLVEKKVNAATQWFEPIRVPEPIEIIFKPSSDTNIFVSPYEPIYFENISIVDEKDQQIAALINSKTFSNPNWDIEISETLKAEVVYKISYTVAVRDITVIDQNTISLVMGGTVLSNGVDYIYSPVSNTIILKRGNVPKSEVQALFISYTRTVTEESNIRYYSTWVFLNKRTIIPISPFTQIEYGRGNFHRFDGVDHSLDTEVVLDTGVHKIESTQPYPSAIGIFNSEDFNYYTQAYSDAYIDLTGLDFRAFEKPMRQVSLTDMEYNIPQNSRALYTIQGGKILINTKPSWVEPSLLATAAGAGSVGNYIMNRSYDKEAQVNKSKPESYKLEIGYTAGSGKRFIKVKVDMERTGIISPRVTRLGIVPVPAN
jgi:hypothetical protein